jgi:hypothetical protein
MSASGYALTRAVNVASAGARGFLRLELSWVFHLKALLRLCQTFTISNIRMMTASLMTTAYSKHTRHFERGEAYALADTESDQEGER